MPLYKPPFFQLTGLESPSVDWMNPENIQPTAPYGELLKITMGWRVLEAKNLLRKVRSCNLNFQRRGVGEVKPQNPPWGSVIFLVFTATPLPTFVCSD